MNAPTIDSQFIKELRGKMRGQRPAKLDATIAAEHFRTARAEVAADAVKASQMGGRFAGGILYNVSLISRGEALGHGMWIDDVTVGQVAHFAQADERGVRSRFTHPDMSSDGLGRHLGRIFGVEVEDQRAIGDLHFARSAHKTPDGNLAEYVMTLAEEDPHAAGLSIVFERDIEQEVDFLLAHGATADDDGFIDLRDFKSPDDDNEANLPHVRLAELRAADVVDEPAANPDGLFDRQPEARIASEFLSYALGVTDQRPAETAFNVDPDRAAQFIQRWLDSHSLQVTPTDESQMKETIETTVTTETTPEEERAAFKAELNRFTEAFGIENGTRWFNEDRDFTEAMGLHCQALQDRLAEVEGQRDELQSRLDNVELGETKPVDVDPTDQPTGKKTFAEYTAQASAN